MKRLGQASSKNAELRRQLDVQAREIASQQELFKEVQRLTEKSRQDEVVASETKLKAEATAREAELHAEIHEVKLQAQRGREELLEQLHDRDAERAVREGQRDEARAQARDLEKRLMSALQAPETNQARVRAVEMELGLLRGRLAKEIAAREAAEELVQKATAEQDQLQSKFLQSETEVRQLRALVAEQTELMSFRQEISRDLQVQLNQQKAESARRLVQEKAKRSAMDRMEHILPRSFLVKALDD